MPCLICGDPRTVRSHIVPRALFHAMKRPGKDFVMSRRDDDGWVQAQSGAYDRRILCEAHEGKLGRVDDYAVRLLKAVRARLDAGAMVVEVENPEPAMLVGFAAAVVWRMAASRTDLAPERMLGPYAKRLEGLLFRDQPFDPLLLLSLNAYRLPGEDILNLGTLPYRYEELDRRFWRFIAWGVIFDLKLDNRDTPKAMAVLAVNRQTELTLYDDLPQNVLREPNLAASLSAMRRPRRPFRRPA